MSSMWFIQRTDSEQGEFKMEIMHWWLIKMVAIQALCVIGVGYGVCLLVKRRLAPAKAKVLAQDFVRVKKSTGTGVSLR